MANIPKICSTARRRSRIIGLPPNIWGLNVILSSNVYSFMVHRVSEKIFGVDPINFRRKNQKVSKI